MKPKLKFPEIYAATNNKNKLEEFFSFFVSHGIEISIKASPIRLENVENALTLEENAFKKAYFLFEEGYKPVFSDDTGLFLPFLDGIPGVYSSRFAGNNATYSSNRRKLMELLKELPIEKRRAYFKTVICWINLKGEVHYFQGKVEGFVLTEERGIHNFGYDPIFLYPPLGKTFGEITLEYKNRISHRSKALQSFMEFLETYESIHF